MGHFARLNATDVNFVIPCLVVYTKARYLKRPKSFRSGKGNFFLTSLTSARVSSNSVQCYMAGVTDSSRYSFKYKNVDFHGLTIKKKAPIKHQNAMHMLTFLLLFTQPTVLLQAGLQNSGISLFPLLLLPWFHLLDKYERD